MMKFTGNFNNCRKLVKFYRMWNTTIYKELLGREQERTYSLQTRPCDSWSMRKGLIDQFTKRFVAESLRGCQQPTFMFMKVCRNANRRN